MSGSRHTSTITLPSDREFVQTWIFDAPRERVFQAVTHPQRIPQWWGPRRTTTTVEQMDVRPGGVWRFVTRDGAGHEDAFHGVYREIVPPARLVQTFEWAGLPGHVSLETLTFEEQNGQTKMTVTSLFATVADRDGTLESGMEGGARETWDRLAELLARG